MANGTCAARSSPAVPLLRRDKAGTSAVSAAGCRARATNVTFAPLADYVAMHNNLTLIIDPRTNARIMTMQTAAQLENAS